MVRDRPATQGEARRRMGRKTLAAGLLLSALLHVVALHVTFEAEREESGTEGDGATTQNILDAIRVLELAFPEEPAAVPAVELEVDASIPVDPPSVYFEEEPENPTAEPTPDARDGPSLGPRMTDPRLWAPVTSPEVTRPSLSSQPRSRLDALNEKSADVRVPAAGDMSVWTTRDGEGDRWGFSPGQIHFGGVVLPLCGGQFDAASCGLGVPPSFREEYRKQLRGLYEIRQQGNRALLEERARAIRARLNAVRDSAPPS